jgi:hypothetical protein
MALSIRLILSFTALSGSPTIKYSFPRASQFTSTVIVMASTPNTVLPNVFTNMTRKYHPEKGRQGDIQQELKVLTAEKHVDGNRNYA